MRPASPRLFALGQPDPGGRALVLLHGAGGHHGLWEPVRDQLRAAGLPTVAIDLPGHGRSPGPPCVSIAESAAAVGEALRERAIGRALLVGHSMGGAVALALGAAAGPAVVGLGVVSSGARLPVDPMILRGARSALQCTAEHLARFCFARGAPASWLAQVSEAMLAAGAETLWADLTACSRFHVSPAELDRIRLPVEVVCGCLDVLTPPALSQELATHLPRAHLSLLPGCGHTPLLEAPASLVGALARLWGRAFPDGPAPI